MQPWLARRLVHPLLLGLRGEPVAAQLADLSRSAAADPEAVREEQLAALRRVVAAGARRHGFYGSLLAEHGLDPAGPRSLDDLAGWPRLGKEHLRLAVAGLREAGDLPRHTVRLSGGSSGEPSVVLADRVTSGRSLAARELVQGWHGLRPGDRQIRFWGRPLAANARREALKDRLLNRRRLDSLALGGAALPQTVARIARFGAEYLYGYASLLRMFGEALDGEQAAALRRAGLKVAVSTSEVLPDAQRLSLAGRLGVPVVDEYGCSEVDIVAFMCPRGHRHVIAGNVLVEVVREGDEPAGYGRVVVSDLTNTLMPVVRYTLGDLAPLAAGDCDCGCRWPCLGPVLGRVQGQFIELADGRRVHSQFVVYIVEQLVDEGWNLDRFQIVQEGPDRLALLVVPGAGTPPAPAAMAERLRAAAVDALGPDVAWEARLVPADRLHGSRSGKHRHFVGLADRAGAAGPDGDDR
jgi:phenylacetate-CoA ligase